MSDVTIIESFVKKYTALKEEIAKVMGITPNNVKVKLFRSRKKLASILKEKLEPEIISSYERK